LAANQENLRANPGFGNKPEEWTAKLRIAPMLFVKAAVHLQCG